MALTVGCAHLGLSVDILTGMTASSGPYSQPAHQRMSSTASSSPSASIVTLSSATRALCDSLHTHSTPTLDDTSTTQDCLPNSNDASWSVGRYLPQNHPTLSSIASVNPESYAASPQSNPPAPYPPPPLLCYSSVPPPSLSFSLGSPVILYHMPTRDLLSLFPHLVRGGDGRG